MSKHIEYTQTDRQGSFVAGGSSLHFNHCAIENILKVRPSPEGEILHRIKMPLRSLCNPLEFVYFFDRIAKIMALNFSANTTVNLGAALQGDKLLTMLSGVEQQARYCLMLQNGEFKDFSRLFSQKNALGGLKIKTTPQNQGIAFFSAELTSLNGENIEVRGTSLHSMLRELSLGVLQDLAVSECAYSHHSSAHNLLGVSTTLLVLSRALNENFIPEFQLTPEENRKETIEA